MLDTQFLQQFYALLNGGRINDAAVLAQQASLAQPDGEGACLAMAALSRRSRRYSAALQWLNRGLAANPQSGLLMVEKGRLLADQGDYPLALDQFMRADQVMPDNPAVYKDIGSTLMVLDRQSEAIPYLQKAAKVFKQDSNIHQALGVALINQGDVKAGQKMLETAIPGKKTDAAWHVELARIMLDSRLYAGAKREADIALQLNPREVRAYYIKSDAASFERDYAAVLAARAAVYKMHPSPETLTFLGHGYGAVARYKDARQAFESALSEKPDLLSALSALCYFTTYMDDVTPEYIFDVHARFGQVLEAQHKPVELPARALDKQRKLKIGYVSADFRRHAIAQWSIPFVEAHDHAHFEFYFYYNFSQLDDSTRRFMAAADHWRDVHKMSDSQLADLIVDDGIDILVDWSVHTAGNRLGVFAMKPAPIQISWGGAPYTTGLTRIDYVITDSVMNPPGETEGYYTEQLHRFPFLAGALGIPDALPDVAPLPALRNGYVTFGMFNRLTKVNETCADFWAAILNAIPDSRFMVIAGDEGKEAGPRQWVLDMLVSRGVAADRIRFEPPRKFDEFMGLHNQVDITLDTLPYTGSTTTVNALTMGVPLITVVGKLPTARASASILSSVGRPEWIAHSVEDAVQIATRLTADIEALAALRLGLAEQAKTSVVFDGPRVAREFESAYRTMWEAYCDQQAGKPA